MNKFKNETINLYEIGLYKEYINNFELIIPLSMNIETQLFIAASKGDKNGILDILVMYNLESNQLLALNEKGISILCQLCICDYIDIFCMIESITDKKLFKEILCMHGKRDTLSALGHTMNTNSIKILDYICNNSSELALECKDKGDNKYGLYFVFCNGNTKIFKWLWNELTIKKIKI